MTKLRPMKRVQVTLTPEVYDWLLTKQKADEEDSGIRPSLSSEIFAYCYIAMKKDQLECND
jgi:hypothetical protein